MRKTLLLAFMAIPFVGLSKEYKGRDANKIYPGSNWVLTNDNTNQVEFIQFAEGKELEPSQVESWINAHSKKAQFELKEKSEFTDKLGIQHFRYQLQSNGVALAYSWLNVHIKSGKVYRINGKFNLDVPSTSVPFVNESSALSNALNSVGATQYKWELPAEENRLKHEQNNPNATYFPEGKLTYVTQDNVPNASLKLAWMFSVYAHDPLGRQNIYVDASNGTILFKENLLHHADVNGTAQTKYSGTQSIVSDSYNGSYRLRESGRGNGIRTYNMQQGTSYGSAIDFTDSDNIWNNVNAFQDEAATDAHWGAEMTYDYLSIKHNRNSIDGNGYALYSYVHYDANYGNAFWDGYRMTYGDGAGSTTAYTALDIAGHEIAHGLTTNSANLVYQNESGALNESFSDIFGATIENYARPSNYNWLIGEDIGYVIRSMSNPNQYGDPDCYGGTYWYTGTQDNGGVHTNSGVQNFWYYLMVNGGSGTNDLGNFYNVNSIGYDDAGAIAYRNLVVYLGQTSDYSDANFYSILSAVDLFGNCSNQVESAATAWYAVGVGSPYVPFVDGDFTANKTQHCTTPAVVEFQNLSSNGLSYTWHFGDGSSSSSINPTHVYNDTGYYDVTLIVNGGSCGIDTFEIQNFIYVSPSVPCDVIMPTSGVGPLQTACEGRLLDSGGSNGNYGDMESSRITISPTNATSITLNVISFDIEPGSGSYCNYDYLEIYSGTNVVSTNLIGRYCNTTSIPSTININNSSVTIRFYSDQYLNMSGFELEWICTTPAIAPVADFAVSELNVCDGEFQFLDNSQNQPTSWYWDFGDGNTSTQQNPTHTYAQPGTYSVQLTASNSAGNDAEYKSGFIQAGIGMLTNVSGDSICYNETAILHAQPNGVARWYDSQTNGNLLFTGDTFVTSNLTSSTTFYVEDYLSSQPYTTGEPDNNKPGFYSASNSNYLVFDVFSSTTLRSVSIYASTSGFRTIELRTNGGLVLDSYSQELNSGLNVVPVNFELNPGSNYQLGLNSSSLGNLYQTTSDLQFPYTISGVLSIKYSQNSNTMGYPYFYDWDILEYECTSDRSMVQVIVDETCWPASVGNISDSDLIRVYPNPFGGQFQVDLSAVENQEAQVKVYTITGQMIYSNKVKTGSVSTIDLNLFAAGTYWLEVQLNEGVYQKQMVKQY